MKSLICLLALVYTTSSFAGGFADWWANCGNDNTFCQAKVVRVYDGDTFYVNIDKVHSLFGSELGIRVAGIDTPEMRGGTPESKAQAILARDFTVSFLEEAKRVDLTNCVRGKFFRIVCDVIGSKDKSLAEELLKANLAVKYDK